MWLASLSLRDKHGKVVGAEYWDDRQLAYAQHLLTDVLLAGVGDPERERMFRMCITLCLHRGVRADELAQIPEWWHTAESVDLAGGPLHIYYARGVPDVESAKPCHAPRKAHAFPGRRDLYLPEDCGQCPPCRARARYGSNCSLTSQLARIAAAR